MSDAKLVNIARLMTTYNFEIKQFPDNLKCTQCKLLLRSAFQGPCCCRYCRVCIDDMMAREGEFCPGDSEVCGESLLSVFVPDFVANKSVSILIVKCPNNGCVHECRLANMEKHLRECPRKNEECPFRELGCTQNKLAAEDMSGHLQHDNRKHSEILIEMIANINREIDTLKRRDEARTSEIDTLKDELVIKDEQIRSIMDQMILVQNENESIKNEIKLIKEEKDPGVQVRIPSAKMERKIAKRSENDELDMTTVIEQVNKVIDDVTALIGSNKDELTTEMYLVKTDMRSRNQNFHSIENDISSLALQVQSIQVLLQIEATCVWRIDADVVKTRWDWGDKCSDYFFGAVHPYKYRMRSVNYDIDNDDGIMGIDLRLYPSLDDERLSWPFEARVVITVTDMDNLKVCRSISRQCRIERPTDNAFNWSNDFDFLHSDLIRVGLDLGRGVRISCAVVVETGNWRNRNRSPPCCD